MLIVTLKILITAKKLNSTDMTLFLRGGAYADTALTTGLYESAHEA